MALIKVKATAARIRATKAEVMPVMKLVSSIVTSPPLISVKRVFGLDTKRQPTRETSKSKISTASIVSPKKQQANMLTRVV